uniref:Expansin-like EG45 domain-containing protein n=1 Tax=Lactuca sativa TaxID=4236 RepID=A0A9R1V5W1_LACSA|nr:hypothetical protein LSAT_V11C600317090 [Lactuca sativa]
MNHSLPMKMHYLVGFALNCIHLIMLNIVSCAHPFCNTCWPIYISTSINDNPDCLTLKYPIPSFGVVVDVDMWCPATPNPSQKNISSLPKVPPQGNIMFVIDVDFAGEISINFVEALCGNGHVLFT